MLVNNTVRVKVAMLLNYLRLKFEYCGCSQVHKTALRVREYQQSHGLRA